MSSTPSSTELVLLGAPVALRELTEDMVRYLTEIDHHDHEAMIALDEQTGEGIGVARYVFAAGLGSPPRSEC